MAALSNVISKWFKARAKFLSWALSVSLGTNIDCKFSRPHVFQAREHFQLYSLGFNLHKIVPIDPVCSSVISERNNLNRASSDNSPVVRLKQ